MNGSKRGFAGTITYALFRLNIAVVQLAVRPHCLHVIKLNVKNTLASNLHPGDHSARCILMARRVQNVSDNELAFIRKMMELRRDT